MRRKTREGDAADAQRVQRCGVRRDDAPGGRATPIIAAAVCRDADAPFTISLAQADAAVSSTPQDAARRCRRRHAAAAVARRAATPSAAAIFAD